MCTSSSWVANLIELLEVCANSMSVWGLKAFRLPHIQRQLLRFVSDHLLDCMGCMEATEMASLLTADVQSTRCKW